MFYTIYNDLCNKTQYKNKLEVIELFYCNTFLSFIIIVNLNMYVATPDSNTKLKNTFLDIFLLTSIILYNY